MKIPFQKEWLVLEKEDYAHYLFVVSAWEGATFLFKKWGFIPSRFLGAEYINTSCNLFACKHEFDKNNRKHFQFFFTKPDLWSRLNTIKKENTRKLFILCQKIKKKNVTALSNKELLNLFWQFQNAQMLVHVPRGPMWLLETPDTILSNYLQKYLTEQYEMAKQKTISPVEAFRILTTPWQKSILTREQEEMAKIGLVSGVKKQAEKLAKHAKKYEWIEYGLQGKVLPFQYFQDEFNKMKKEGYKKKLRLIAREVQDLKKAQQNVLKKYHLDVGHKKIFQIVRDSAQTTLDSKFIQFYGFYTIENALREIGKRVGLTLEQIRFLSPYDYKEILLKKKDFSSLANQNMKYSVHIASQGKTIFFTGEKAKQIIKRMRFYKDTTPKGKMEKIKGQPAYDGKALGRVKIINTRQEMVKMHAGNILVSHMTNPDLVPAMKQAAAIITDMGGITCHAAIVARELKKPCIIGTKIATQILKDGDEVKVDADKGTVIILKH